MLLLLSGIGMYKLHLVSLVLKEPQSDAVELKPWMTTFDLLNDLLLCFFPVYYEAYRNPKRSCLSYTCYHHNQYYHDHNYVQLGTVS